MAKGFQIQDTCIQIGSGTMVKVISLRDAEKQTIENLRLDASSLDLSSVEGIAGVIRKVAGFICPCTNIALRHAVESLIGPFIENFDKDILSNIVNSLISYGDLLELTSIDSGIRKKQIYCGPPAFVRLSTESVLLTGIVPDHFTPLPERLESRVICTNHVRRLTNLKESDISMLHDIGLMEFPQKYWMRHPELVSPEEYLSGINGLLDKQDLAEDIENIVFLYGGSESKKLKYKKRWKKSTPDNGRYVARRPRKYGNDMWSYVEVKERQVTKVLNLPVTGKGIRGCDEGWRIQLALDCLNNNANEVTIREAFDSGAIFDFIIPVPMWALRRWDALGEPIPTRDSLFSYRFTLEEDCEREAQFCSKDLWMKVIDSRK